MTKIRNVPITESTLKAWNEMFIPSFDLFYFEDINSVTSLLSNDVLIYTRDELQTDHQFCNLDIRTTFLTWNVKQTARYVCAVPNNAVSDIDRDIRDLIFLKQWELGRGQIYDLSIFEDLTDSLASDERIRVNEILRANTFVTPRGEMVALQKKLWDKLPWELRAKFLMKLAEEYADPSIWNDISLDIRKEVERQNPHISSKFECFSSSNGPNCFASALAAASNSKHTTEWTIQKWLQPKSLLLGLEVRNYQVVTVCNKSTQPEELQMTDVILWRDRHGNYVHATYSLGYGLVFNKDGQTMFNPWQVLKLADVLKNWNRIVEDGGEMIIYRQATEQAI